MSGLTFVVTGAEPDRTALAPTLQVTLAIDGDTERRVQSILLRCQIRIEPELRTYEPDEQAHLLDVFGEPERWSDTLTPFLLTHVTMPIGGFTGSTSVRMPVELSYDLEVASGKYLHALRHGAVPLLLLFSGTVFHQGPAGLQVEQIGWDSEARYNLPVAVWTAVIDSHYPGTSWLRLQRDTIDDLQAYKARHALPTWDAAVTALLQSRQPTQDAGT